MICHDLNVAAVRKSLFSVREPSKEALKLSFTRLGTFLSENGLFERSLTLGEGVLLISHTDASISFLLISFSV